MTWSILAVSFRTPRKIAELWAVEVERPASLKLPSRLLPESKTFSVMPNSPGLLVCTWVPAPVTGVLNCGETVFVSLLLLS